MHHPLNQAVPSEVYSAQHSNAPSFMSSQWNLMFLVPPSPRARRIVFFRCLQHETVFPPSDCGNTVYTNVSCIVSIARSRSIPSPASGPFVRGRDEARGFEVWNGL